jgi:hypothetical protein
LSDNHIILLEKNKLFVLETIEKKIGVSDAKKNEILPLPKPDYDDYSDGGPAVPTRGRNPQKCQI